MAKTKERTLVFKKKAAPKKVAKVLRETNGDLYDPKTLRALQNKQRLCSEHAPESWKRDFREAARLGASWTCGPGCMHGKDAYGHCQSRTGTPVFNDRNGCHGIDPKWKPPAKPATPVSIPVGGLRRIKGKLYRKEAATGLCMGCTLDENRTARDQNCDAFISGVHNGSCGPEGADCHGTIWVEVKDEPVAPLVLLERRVQDLEKQVSSIRATLRNAGE